LIKIVRSDGFSNQEKKLKKHQFKIRQYNMIMNHIKRCRNIEDLKCNPVSKIYGLEQLKYELNAYHSFNLCKNGGTIRLIVRIKQDIIELIYISMDHYEDFKKVRKMYE